MDRSLEALGLGGVPFLEPLTYPGLSVTEPGLLAGGELLPLTVRKERLGAWTLCGQEHALPDRSISLDDALNPWGRSSQHSLSC